eukprot:NODE_1715_length_554_cov_240.221782_g1381_i0.p1 GENE.NODE_1715_length_554_cov_240.221782_g1381_i0~~NODE_1715_length_554_cov_240.221782_g1381_i0.p1  ORF type:complete len:150 (-),score=16.24 NODE_1715_length_554_cov_240.221782_g1381_i0:72-521(-)
MGLFLEDLTGSNLMLRTDTNIIYAIDLESISFPLGTGLMCQASEKKDQCPVPRSWLWGRPYSLNSKMYKGAAEWDGLCNEDAGVCPGVDTRLHVYGLGKWLYDSAKEIVGEREYSELVYRMISPKPQDRPSFVHVSQTLSRLITEHNHR